MYRFVLHWNNGDSKEIFGKDFWDAWAHSGLANFAKDFCENVDGPYIC